MLTLLLATSVFQQSTTLVSKATGFSLIITALVLVLSSSPAYAQTPSPALKCGDPGAPTCISEIVPILKKIITLLAPAAGIAFLIMLLVGGFQFINSGGDPKAAGQARTTLTYAFIGILLVVASWLILTVIADITGADVTNVDLPI